MMAELPLFLRINKNARAGSLCERRKTELKDRVQSIGRIAPAATIGIWMRRFAS